MVSHNDKKQQVVVRLFDAILDNDNDRILSFFSDHSVFQPLSGDPVIGHTAIWAALNTPAGAVERRLECVVGQADGQVRAERTERVFIDGRWQERRVTGLLAVRGCKIIRWQDIGAA